MSQPATHRAPKARNRAGDWLPLAIVNILAFAVILATSDNVFQSIFQVRDIQRSQDLFTVGPIFFGPEASIAGYLPGGFYYYLIAIPYRLGGWQGLWLFIVTLNLAAASVVYVFALRRFGRVPALVGYVACVGHPLFYFGLVLFLNPTVAMAMSAVLTVLLYEAHARKSRAHWILFGLLCGLAVQAHASAAVFVAAAVGVAILDRQARARVALGAVGLAAALAPHLVWLLARAMGTQLGQPESGVAYPTTASLPGLVRGMGGNVAGGVSPATYLADVVIYFSVPMLVAIAWAWRRHGRLGLWRGPQMSLAVAALSAGVASMFALLYNGHPWYGMIAVAPQALFLAALTPPVARRRSAFGLVGGVLALSLASHVPLWLKPTIPAGATALGRNLSEFVFRHSGQPYAVVRERVYLVRSQRMLEFGAAYAEVIERSPTSVVEDPADGFVVAGAVPADVTDLEGMRAWLLEGRLEASLQSRLAAGTTKLRDMERFGATVAIAYDHIPGTITPVKMTNFGYVYHAPQSPGRAPDGYAVLHECEDSFCDVTASVYFEGKPGRFILTVDGRILQQPDAFLSYRMLEIRDLEVRVECPDGEQRHALVPRLGLTSSEAQAELTLVAPYEVAVDPGCVPDRIAVGFGGSSLVDETGVHERSAAEFLVYGGAP